MMNQNKLFKKIGVFDSGIGGLTVLQELIKLPIPEFIYFADTAHLPYGEKSKDEIEALTFKAVTFLLSHQVDAIVIACHTASANAGDFIRKQFPDLAIFDVVSPVVKSSIEKTKNNRIGILGTRATITSGIHQKKILKSNPNILVFNQACPALVPLIEDGLKNQQALYHALQEYLNPMIENNVDTLIIGCTHYELLKEQICLIIGSDISLISAPQLTCNEIKKNILIKDVNIYPEVSYFVSGNQKHFLSNAKNLVHLAMNNKNIQSTDLSF